MSEGKTGRILALGALAVFLTGGAATAQDKVVNVYNWSDYIAEEVLAQFEAETGIKVVYDTFDSNEIVETKLLAGGTGYEIESADSRSITVRDYPAVSCDTVTLLMSGTYER